MKCAIYCRLSREDDKLRRESESIRNQRDMLTSYAAEKEWDVYEVYSDDDYSGADTARPGFRAMLKAAEEGCFDVILCKTQSRFTRDMEAVEKYIHKLFPIWGIRFVAVLDNIDTADKANKKARQINGLVNEWYLEDLSENIRAVFEQKRKDGKYIASFAVYGYKKDPQDHNHLLIDDEAAEHVRLIFSMYLSGLGTQKVADRLNALSILPPKEYRQARAGTARAYTGGKWSATAVSRILRNEVYLGATVQGMTAKQSYKTKKCVRVPKSEWVRVEHTHEAIIGKSAFEAASLRLAAHTRSDGSGKPYSLAGKLFCADCGSGFIKVSHKYKGEAKAYLQCKAYAANRKNPACTKHSVKLHELEDIVAERLQALIKTYYKAENLSRLNRCADTHTYHEKELEAAKQRIERLSAAVRSLYIDKVEGEISAELFGEMSEAILAERTELKSRVQVLERISQAKSRKKTEALADIKQIDKLLCDLFIERIEIGEEVLGSRQVRICWKV